MHRIIEEVNVSVARLQPIAKLRLANSELSANNVDVVESAPRCVSSDLQNKNKYLFQSGQMVNKPLPILLTAISDGQPP